MAAYSYCFFLRQLDLIRSTMTSMTMTLMTTEYFVILSIIPILDTITSSMWTDFHNF